MKSNELGLIHIYCGDGKGKTTCSVGLSVRASGYGLHVLFMQFLKKGDSSELNVLRKLPGIDVMKAIPVTKFSFQMTDKEKDEVRKINADQIAEIRKMVEMDHYDMVVMDECLGAIEAGLLDEKEVTDFLENRPEQLEIVLTGRNPSDRLIEMADYVSRIDKVKHPYDEGIPARNGIEK